MSEENKPTSDNPYINAVLDNDVKAEYEETKEEYKAARKQCKTIDERKQLMRHYQDDLIELAITARIAGDNDFNAALNLEIKSLTRRLWSGSTNSW
tara:strand:- start:169 stop:456 length:288 start_codon:yes stop_codon:yes gene_type:complete